MKKLLHSVVFTLLLVPQLCFAKIPGFDQAVYLEPNGQTPNAFVKSLFGQIGVPVRIDGEIDGLVDGVFDDTAENVFKEFSQKFDAHVYFDRKIAYIYRSDDVIEKTLPMSNRRAKEVFRLIKERDVTDALNQIYLVPGEGLDVVGNSRFIERVELKVLNLQLPAKSGSATSGSATNGAAQVKKESPQAKTVFKQFRLKYASVVDQTVISGGAEQHIPGVETLLWAFVNDGAFASLEMMASVSTGGSTSASNQPSTKKDPAVMPVGVQTDVKSTDADDLEKVSPTSAAVRYAQRSANGALPVIKADPYTNSLYIKDTVDRLEEYQQMIAIWDQKPRMVEIEVSIIDINNSKQRELGVNWRAFNGGNSLLLGQGTAADFRLLRGDRITPGADDAAVSLSWGDTTKFIARMRALEELGAAKFVSKPHVTTKSNLEATVSSTNEFLVKLEGAEAVSLEEQSFGTVLTVTPRVIENGIRDAIDLGILVEDGIATGDFVADLPEISRSVLNTHAVMEQGESLLIGGLIREAKEKSTKKVPIIGDVPLLGKLFTSNGNHVARKERLILITPKIIEDTSSASTGDRILKGDAKDIIKNSDERLAEASEQIELLADRQTLAVNGESPFKKPIEVFKQTVLSPQNQPEVPVVKTQLSDLTVIPELPKSQNVAEPDKGQEIIVNQNPDGRHNHNQTAQAIAVGVRPVSNKVWSVGVIEDSTSKWKEAVH